ncbi:hypothetical protein AB0H28_24670 [Micromonospora sp. NPDC050980]|uniref:hypothetical protein n=1 Tax=Micromonospora sp. NPDC050980 TaxID=3155161 RepID=UPI0033FE8D8F
MSVTSTDRAADRPAEVTDPLLWDLSAAVADAHQPDAERTCASPSCAGAAWPCPAWHTAQAGLTVARAGATAARAGATVTGAARPGDALAAPVSDADRPAAEPRTGEGRLVATAA